jgi:hypothetical protein
MNLQIFRRSVVLLTCTLLLLSPVGASTISFLPSSVTVHKNTTAEISLMLDEAPAGLFGYDLVIQLSHPKTARIRDVKYPSWASLEDTTQLTAGSVRIKGADISQQVEAGKTGISLATLTIEGTATGTSALLIESVTLQNDKEEEINPGLVAGQIIVPGSNTTGSEGSVAYTEPTPTMTGNNSSNLTILQTKTMNETALNTSPVSTVSPAVHTTTGTPGTLQPNATYSASEIPGGEQGIPWTWFLGGVVLLCAIVPVAFFLHRKRKKDL